jgi:invasion protein IalB
MEMKMKHILTLFYAVLVFWGVNSASAQQSVQGEGASKTQSIQTAETGWQVVCRASNQDRTKMGCSVIHETYSAQDRSRLTSVEIIKNDKSRTMIVSVPQGVSLKDGIEFGIDGAKQSLLAYSYCMSNSCFATFELSDSVLNTLKKSKALELTFLDLQASKIKTDIPMSGFVQALAKAD